MLHIDQWNQDIEEGIYERICAICLEHYILSICVIKISILWNDIDCGPCMYIFQLYLEGRIMKMAVIKFKIGPLFYVLSKLKKVVVANELCL